MGVANGQISPQAPTPKDISGLAPDGRMKLTVTFAADKEERLSKVGAAPCVITREDIASSGGNNVRGANAMNGVINNIITWQAPGLRNVLAKLTWRF